MIGMVAIMRDVLLRAGVCIRCPAAIAAHLEERDEPNQVKVTVCSGACREAVRVKHMAAPTKPAT
jgi:hypothetical protein